MDVDAEHSGEDRGGALGGKGEQGGGAFCWGRMPIPWRMVALFCA